MIGWAILAVYLLGYVLSVRFLAQRVLSMWDTDPRRDMTSADRGEALGMAAALAIGWPLVIPFFIIRVRTSMSWLKSDKEIARQQHAELVHLRALAREYGLPMPGEDRK